MNFQGLEAVLARINVHRDHAHARAHQENRIIVRGGIGGKLFEIQWRTVGENPVQLHCPDCPQRLPHGRVERFQINGPDRVLQRVSAETIDPGPQGQHRPVGRGKIGHKGIALHVRPRQLFQMGLDLAVHLVQQDVLLPARGETPFPIRSLFHVKGKTVALVTPKEHHELIPVSWIGNVGVRIEVNALDDKVKFFRSPEKVRGLLVFHDPLRRFDKVENLPDHAVVAFIIGQHAPVESDECLADGIRVRRDNRGVQKEKKGQCRQQTETGEKTHGSNSPYACMVGGLVAVWAMMPGPSPGLSTSRLHTKGWGSMDRKSAKTTATQDRQRPTPADRIHCDTPPALSL